MNNLDKHKRFMALLSSGIPIPADLAEWYLNAYERHKDEGKPLCNCLGIRGSGIRSAKTIELIHRRDNLLLWAANSCTSYPGEPLWNKCVTLSAQFKRYPRSKNENPLLVHVFGLDCKPPKSPHGIYERISPLAMNTHYSPRKSQS